MECDLNMFHACILDLLPFEKAYSMISCLMNSMSSSLVACSKKLNIDLEPIQNCVNSDNGINLLIKHGNQTNSIDLTFVPTIEFEDDFKWTEQSQMRFNFKNYFCRQYQLKYSKQLDGCRNARRQN